eukprot:g70313.t1
MTLISSFLGVPFPVKRLFRPVVFLVPLSNKTTDSFGPEFQGFSGIPAACCRSLEILLKSDHVVNCDVPRYQSTGGCQAYVFDPTVGVVCDKFYARTSALACRRRQEKNRMSDNEPEEQHEEPDNKQAEEKKVPDPAVEEVIEGNCVLLPEGRNHSTRWISALYKVFVNRHGLVTLTMLLDLLRPGSGSLVTRDITDLLLPGHWQDKLDRSESHPGTVTTIGLVEAAVNINRARLTKKRRELTADVDLKYDLKLSADGLSASANVYSILTELETKCGEELEELKHSPQVNMMGVYFVEAELRAKAV